MISSTNTTVIYPRIKQTYPLYSYLINHNFIEVSPKLNNLHIPTYYQTNPISHVRSRHSRPDAIWFPCQLHPDIIYTNVQNIDDLYSTDHQLLQVFFSSINLFRDKSLAQAKQRQETDICFQEKKMNNKSWIKFTDHTDVVLLEQLTAFSAAKHPQLSHEINRLWNILSTTIIKLAKAIIPKKQIYNRKQSNILKDLQNLYQDLSSINRILSYFTISKITSQKSCSHLNWNRKSISID